MPSSTQIRKERIQELIQIGKDAKNLNYDYLEGITMRLFPFVHEKTRHSYIVTAMKYLHNKENVKDAS